MSLHPTFTAQLLETGGRGYAALATALLLERRPDLEQMSGASASWRAHLAQRLQELQTATGLGRPEIFSERVNWSRRAYRARGVQESELQGALQCLREVLAEELPEAAQKDALSILDAALSGFDQPLSEEVTVLNPEDDVDRRALRYLLLVLEGRPRQAIDEVLAARQESELSLEDCILRILLPAQREIGRLWHLGDSDVAEEHLVTATTKRALSVLGHFDSEAEAIDRTLLSAAVQGDTHDVGGLALAVLLEAEGWRCVDLGADVPAEDLVSAYLAFEPDVFLLSATLSHHLAPLERSVRALRQQAGGDLRLLVGGLAVNEVGDLPLEWGADEIVGSLPDAMTKVKA